jgi:hypothetical protein
VTGAALFLVLLEAAAGRPGMPGCVSTISGEPPVFFGNDWIYALVTPSISGVRAGSLLQLLDLESGVDLAAGLQFGGVQCGPFVPQDGIVLSVSDSEVVFNSPGMIDYSTSEELPIEISIDYRLNGRGLEMTFVIHAAGEAELPYPLEVDFSTGAFDRAVFSNQSGLDREMEIDGTHGLLRISGDQVASLQSDDGLFGADFVFPNPSTAILALNDTPPPSNPYLTLRFFDEEPPRETAAGPLLHSILPSGYTATAYVRLSLSPGFMPAYISSHPGFLERSASWMLDDIPFRHPPDTTLWSYSTTSSGGEYCSAWLIALLEAHPSLEMNWLILPDAILAPNCDSMWAEPGMEDSWSHWHCTWRIATMAPPDYLQWLQNIENDVYPWADRVSLGGHGYHHTPSPDSAWDPFHEFITYEPDEHLERFRMIREDFASMGLDTTVHRALRFPGHRTSLSGLYAIIRYGYAFYCNGIRWYETMGGEPFYDLYLSHYVTPDGEIWGTNTVWWGDYQSAYPCEYLSTVMSRGKHCLLGGHPGQMWGGGSPAAWSRIDSVCTSLERDYPYFGWLLPEDYGRFLSQTSDIVFTGIAGDPGQVTVTFEGEATCGQTMVVDLPSLASVEQVYVDGTPVIWEMHGFRLFASIDGLAPGPHTFVADLAGTSVERGAQGPPPQYAAEVASPFAGSITVRCEGLEAFTRVRILAYDISGRLVAETDITSDASGSLDESLPGTTQLPSGMYLVCVSPTGLPAGTFRAVKLH